MRIAIHQPNFVPWYPFFQKMKEVDLFVLLCHCQFEKGNFQNRFRVNDRWHTMSVNHGLDPIVDKVYVNPQKDWSAIKGSLPQFNKVLSLLDSYVGASLYWTNQEIIRTMAKLLGITTPIHLDQHTGLKATDRLIHICQVNGATQYLAGQGGPNYMEMDKFAKAGIKVDFQNTADKRHTLEVLHERS